MLLRPLSFFWAGLWVSFCLHNLAVQARFKSRYAGRQRSLPWRVHRRQTLLFVCFGFFYPSLCPVLLKQVHYFNGLLTTTWASESLFSFEYFLICSFHSSTFRRSFRLHWLLALPSRLSPHHWVLRQIVPLGHRLFIWWRLLWVGLRSRLWLVLMKTTWAGRSLSLLVSIQSIYLSFWTDQAAKRFRNGFKCNWCEW